MTNLSDNDGQLLVPTSICEPRLIRAKVRIFFKTIKVSYSHKRISKGHFKDTELQLYPLSIFFIYYI